MARDSDDDRVRHRDSRSRSRSYSSSRRHKHKKSSHRRRYSSSRSRSNSKSRSSRHKLHRKNRSYSRSSSRERSRRRRNKKHKKRRYSSSSSSSYSGKGKSHSGRSSRDRDRSKRSVSSDRRKGISKSQQDEQTLMTMTRESCTIKDLTESEKLAREKALESIASDSFIQQAFVSSRKNKDDKHTSNDDSKEEFDFGTKAELLSKKFNLDEGSLFSPHLFGDPAEREEKYIKRIYTLRQKLLLEGRG